MMRVHLEPAGGRPAPAASTHPACGGPDPAAAASGPTWSRGGYQQEHEQPGNPSTRGHHNEDLRRAERRKARWEPECILRLMRLRRVPPMRTSTLSSASSKSGHFFIRASRTHPSGPHFLGEAKFVTPRNTRCSL